MNWKSIATLLLLLVWGAGLPKKASAQIGNRQGIVPRYEPQRPTTSPYLNLLRRDSGVLPNYQAFVRPAQEQYRFNRQYDAEIRRQRLSIEGIEDVVTDRQRPSEMRATGTNSVFMNYMHYFPRTYTGRPG